MIPDFLKEKNNPIDAHLLKNKRPFFVDKTTKNMASFIITAIANWNSAQRNGFMQQLDARVKVIFMLIFLVLSSLLQNLESLITLAFFAFCLFAFSKTNIISAYKKILIFTFLFGIMIFFPATLNVFSKGEIIFPILSFRQEYKWLIYSIPTEIGITKEGLFVVARLSLKVFNSVSFTLLLINTTTFEQIVKALRMLKVPEIFLLTLTLSYKFIFIFSRTIIETYQALKMRWWNRSANAETDAILAGRMAYLFRKSWDKYELVYQAMIARGYTGSVHFYSREKLMLLDYLFAFFSLIILLIFIYLNFIHA